MTYNSYIFLIRDDEKDKINNNERKLTISIAGSFDLLMQKYFKNLTFDNKKSLHGFLRTGKFNIQIGDRDFELVFKCYKLKDTIYLDILSNIKKKNENLIIFNHINKTFTEETNDFYKYYIPIISYDFVSEQLGKEAFKYLNIFERKLKKLMFNIYTIRFGKDYWNINKPYAVVNGIKKNANISRKGNVDRNTNYIQQAFFMLDYNSIMEIMFTRYLTDEEKNELNNFLKKEKDLSKLTDKEIRRIIELSSAKNDWERIFSLKIDCADFEKKFDMIRLFRNDVAHCKIINPDEYEFVIKIIKDLIESTDKAINITTTKDFYDLMISITTKRFDSIMVAVAEAMGRIQLPMINNAMIAAAEEVGKIQLPKINNAMIAAAEAINGINFININNSMKAAIEGITKSTIYNNSAYLQENIKNGLISGMTDSLENNNNDIKEE